MGEPTLMFCTGATKAGTSWLHRYIANHPECHMRGIKELHYFDALELDDWDYWIKVLEKRRDANLAEAEGLEAAQAENKRRVAGEADDLRKVLEGRVENDAGYMDYLKGGLTDQKLVGDFTPAYGLLPQSRLRHMASLVPNVRFVYLLRDPVQRIWSHARMIAGRRADSPDEIPRRARNILNRVLKDKEPEIVKRSDYVGPLQRLEKATKIDQLYVGFYEELFRKDSIARVSQFLGISHGWADFGKRVLESPKVDLERGQWRKMREFLAPQYEGMREMFGTLPDQWDQMPVEA